MSSQGSFELDWYFETKAEFDIEPGVMDAIYKQNATDESISLTVNAFSAFLERLDARWADGRDHVTGRGISAADFNLVAFYTSVITNRGLYNPTVSVKLRGRLEELKNVKRVLENIRIPLDDTIRLLPEAGSWI